jgi:branched-chain amino acid transport system ATP-binding protein
VTSLPTHLIARKRIAYTPQEQTLFQELTVEENLRLGLRDDKAFPEALARISDHFPIVRQRLKQKAGTLSGGEQKMLIVSRALLSKPRLVLIDEISEGLQPSMIERLTGILRAERERTGMAIFVVEQNVPFAFSVADRYAVLKVGEIADEGVAGDADAAARVQDQLRV